ncbi:DUF692 family multinuclear iron-containing protein [Pendulispora albinea]|uniref:DUF692 family protein n=1 Tax=Pendulispora albinea TaxID=2741071 RepID=A0ABZ2LJQ8_9BACT
MDWTRIPRMGIGQRWDGEPLDRFNEFFGEALEYIEPNLPLELGGLPPAMPKITHDAELPLATTGELNSELVAALVAQVRAASPPWTGEHFALASTRVTGNLGYNAAPILDDTAVEAGVWHVTRLQRAYGCPIALEAGPRYLDVRGWDDHGAILRISKATDCGILVDLSHHMVSMLNLGRAPEDGLSPEVLERTVELHLTGLGRHRDGRHFHDFHGGPVAPEVWRLLDWILPRAKNLKAVTLEHDASVDDPTYAADLRRMVRALEPWRSSCGH